MRTQRSFWALLALVAAGCIGPFRCDPNPVIEEPADLAMNVDLQPCTKCGGNCVDIYSDAKNCGGCGIVCASGMCVKSATTGLPFCSCDTDGGVPGCPSPAAPLCNSNGLCTCSGSESGVCAPRYGDSCASGSCKCGSEPACTTLSSDCQPGLSPSCRCGNVAQCDKATASRCEPSSTPSCRCGSNPACPPGTTCCTQNSTCCQPGAYCCLDGCCSHPCLVFGFCAK